MWAVGCAEGKGAGMGPSAGVGREADPSHLLQDPSNQGVCAAIPR